MNDLIEKDTFEFFQRDGCIVNSTERRLTLAYENLTEVPNTFKENYGSIIEIMDLSHNYFEDLSFLRDFEKITTLILDHNNLCGTEDFPKSDTLTTLWLNNNKIKQLHPLISNLYKAFSNLKVLSLMGNEGAPSYLTGGTYFQHLQYRLYVISWLPKLEFLDDGAITVDQRREAYRIFGRPYLKSSKIELNLLPDYFTEFGAKIKKYVDSWTSDISGSSVPVSTAGRMTPASEHYNSSVPHFTREERNFII